ncbi:MAG: hypothetical protein QOF37_753, partial [Thermoleophilaceae bacterium]|nr:hypothetical protein [Thermoleophilaceae bacterium]
MTTQAGALRADYHEVGAHEDPGYLRFRRNCVRFASLSSVTAASMVAAYVAATWDEKPNRGAIAVLLVAAVVVVVLVHALRAERLVETRWCDLFFGTWSTLYVLIISALCWLDGGAASPLAVTFFPALVFAGLCYPLALAVYVGAGCVLGDLVVGLAKSGSSLEVPLYVSGALMLTAVMCAWQAHTMERHRRELARASRTDPLTGALNRRGFNEHAQAELARAFRSGDPVGLVLVDLDDFKRVNDAHGHPAGDELLCWVTDRLREGLRPSDAAARLGGDEFALLLPGLDAGGARAVAERLRARLVERTSASFGIAAYPAR